MSEHWAIKHRSAMYPTREYWLYTVACVCMGSSEDRVNQIVDVLERLEPPYKCVFHASWVQAGKPGKCACAACENSSKGAF